MSTDDAKPSKGKVDTTKAIVQPVLTPDLSAQLNSMFNDFYERSKADKEENKLQFADAHKFFNYIAKQHKLKDKTKIKFVFKKC